MKRIFGENQLTWSFSLLWVAGVIVLLFASEIPLWKVILGMAMVFTGGIGRILFDKNPPS
jgi:hypothetical protein